MKKTLLFICALLISGMCYAQKSVTGNLYDSFTKEIMPQVKVTLMKSDSSFVDSTRSVKSFDYLTMRSISYFLFKVPESGKYIVRCETPNYNTYYKNINVSFSKRIKFINLGSLYLERDYHMLHEVTVTATKIKMVVKGDTVVYNADAFHLAQGSMLDALVRELPGAKLNDNGQIYVNGKFIENLMVNGKDFFKGDPKIALDNLPAYMVNNVKVYNKKDELQKLDNSKKDEYMVMDVILKKQYAVGLIGNAEVGGGTHDRYLARLFALRFTKNSRLAIFGNMNNLNDVRQPGRNGEWNPADMPDGLLSVKMGGLSYRLDGSNNAKGQSYSFQTDNTIEHRDADNSETTASETFLSSGNVFGRSVQNANNRSTKYTTDNTFKYNFTNMSTVEGEWKTNYTKFNNSSSGMSGNFSADPSMYISGNVLDSLFTNNAGSRFLKIITNRYKNESLGNGHSFNTSARWLSFINMNKAHDQLMLFGTFTYSNMKNEMFNHYLLQYLKTDYTDYRNRYYHQPTNSYNYNLVAKYTYMASSSLNLTPYYRFSENYRSKENYLYRLDGLQGWGAGTSYPLGVLPSTTDSLQLAMDSYNSYHSTLHKDEHTVGLTTKIFSDSKKNKGDRFEAKFDLPVRFEHNILNYYKNNTAYPLSKRNVFFEPYVNLRWKSKKKGELNLSYSLSSDTPEMTYLIDIRDDSDPLYISLGNPDLKNTHTHSVELNYQKTKREHSENMFLNLKYCLIENALAMGFSYDTTTGIRTTTPDNVNGNWELNADWQYERTLDKKSLLTISNTTNADYNTNVDLSSVSGSTSSNRSTVHNLYLKELLKLNYKLNKNIVLGSKLGGSWTNATSKRSNFETVNVGDFNYGLTAQINLLYNFQVSTDLTMYSRRGYEDNLMNNNELIWNGRISKSYMKGNLLLMLDGFDILGNLSNVRRTLNAQGRTETYYNVIPRYAMLHIVYRLNIKPKKK